MKNKILIDKVRTILQRVEIAANGQRNTDEWSDAEDNLPELPGVDYWDWIYQAEQDVIELLENDEWSDAEDNLPEQDVIELLENDK